MPFISCCCGCCFPSRVKNCLFKLLKCQLQVTQIEEASYGTQQSEYLYIFGDVMKVMFKVIVPTVTRICDSHLLVVYMNQEIFLGPRVKASKSLSFVRAPIDSVNWAFCIKVHIWSWFLSEIGFFFFLFSWSVKKRNSLHHLQQISYSYSPRKQFSRWLSELAYEVFPSKSKYSWISSPCVTIPSP